MFVYHNYVRCMRSESFLAYVLIIHGWILIANARFRYSVQSLYHDCAESWHKTSLPRIYNELYYRTDTLDKSTRKMTTTASFHFAFLIIVAAFLVRARAHCVTSWLGDGWCDEACNNRENKFDDGDCCELTCTAKPRIWPCGANGYNCSIVKPIPSWFRQTKLCYKWRPDGSSAAQCGGSNPPPRDICAFVGSRTQDYWDDTDGRGGGCRMQWGLVSPYSPEWFRDNVQICYRWYADGNGGQCGGGAPQEMCAPIGSYTQEYRDDTDNRSGGCRMSWKLSTPASSPQWLRDVKLCFYWSGPTGQCGGGAPSELCAKANFWTTYYRDDTDNRGGGCHMQWALQI